jgi:hypothetical protein
VDVNAHVTFSTGEIQLGRWINVTTNPTAEWVARQITEAFPWDRAPGYMIRDCDPIYGTVVARRLRAMGIRDKPTAPASPWQNGFAERLIGSIRRECLDHIIVLGEAHLRRILFRAALGRCQYLSTSMTAWAKACGASCGRLWPIPPMISRCSYLPENFFA